MRTEWIAQRAQNPIRTQIRYYFRGLRAGVSGIVETRGRR